MVSLKKKTLNHPTADKAKRQLFLEELKQFQEDERPIVYLDESGFKAHGYRPYGYTKKGVKCFGEHNWHLKNQTNAIGAIYNNQLFAVGLYDCSVNSDVFYSWVEQLLLPQLPSNSVIVMDNATFHKRLDIQEAIEELGHTILWLPPYSPDLNPIEPREHSSCLALGRSSTSLYPRSGLGLRKSVRIGDWIVLIYYSSISFGCLTVLNAYDYIWWEKPNLN